MLDTPLDPLSDSISTRTKGRQKRNDRFRRLSTKAALRHLVSTVTNLPRLRLRRVSGVYYASYLMFWP